VGGAVGDGICVAVGGSGLGDGERVGVVGADRVGEVVGLSFSGITVEARLGEAGVDG